MYADDIKIYGRYNHSNKTEVCQALSQSIVMMAVWANVWKIPLNPSKTSVFHIGEAPTVEFGLNNCAFRSASEVRDLGIFLDSGLDFNNHIDIIVRRAFSVLFSIFRNLKCNDSTILIKLYKSYVLPVLEYCSQIWSPSTRKQIEKIEKVQKTFTKILFSRCVNCFNSIRTCPRYKERLKLFGLDSLLYRRIVNDLLFCFKILKGESRLKASKYWTFLPTQGRRNSYCFRYPKVKKKYREKVFNSLFFRGARWLQMLPPSLLEAPNAYVFRKQLKRIDLLSTLNIPDIA